MRQDWDKRKIGEICEVLNGFAFKSSEYVENGIRVIRITNVQKGFVVDDDPKYYPMTAKESIKSYLLNSGDLLMSLTGNVGRVGVLQKEMLPAALNQRVACLRIKDKRVLLKYLFHNLNSPIFEQDCINSASGVAQKNMSTEWLKKYLIGIPPIAEQEKIVAELDCLTGIIEKKKQQLEELNKLAQSIFYDMFGDPITNEKGWEVSNIGSLCTDVRYGTSRPACDGGKYTYLRMGNLTYEGSIDLSDIKRIDIPDNEIEKYIVRKGDVLFNRTNSLDLVGKTCLFDLDEEMVIAGYIIRVRLNRLVLPLYLVRILNTTRYKKMFRNLAKGAVNQANINAREFQSVVIPVPPLNLQELFAQKIEAIEKQKEQIKKSIQETETLFNSRMDYWFNN